ncbi:hypothetical protein BH10PSE6_BH10PSE6_19490 [soil metagenome]
MDMQHSVLGPLVDWARNLSRNDPNDSLEQLARDKSDAKAEICAVMERLAGKHGIPLQHVEPETQGFVDEALSILTLDREDELRAEIEIEDAPEPEPAQ